MDLHLNGKRALVTGGSEGIGRATVLALAEEGCDVAFCARRPDVLAEVAEEVRRRTGRRAVPIAADLSSLSEVERFVAGAAAALGGVDIVVNNVGTSMFGLLDDVPDERWLADVELKLIGYVRVARAAIPHMRGRGGRIINMAGNSGRQPIPYHLSGGAANAAILNFTVALAQQVAADGIHVIAIAPGPVRTARFTRQVAQLAREAGTTLEEAERRFVETMPLKRVPTADEVAGVIAFLASDRAAYMTGTTVTMDGGITKGL